MNLFLAMTPAQLLNSIVLQSTVFKKDESDLYYTENIETYVEHLKQFGIFHDEYKYKLVDDITDRSTAMKRGLVRIKNALDIKTIMDTAPSDLRNYNKVFASGISLRNYELYYAIKKINKDAEIIIYEEGICEYYHFMEKSISKEMFSRLFFHSYYPRECREMYVYEPSIVRKQWDNIRVSRIPKFVDNDQLLQILNTVFEYKEDECSIFKDTVVFLESCFYDLESEQKQTDYLNLIIRVFGKDNVIVKMHPRSKKGKYGNDIRVVNSPIPFEVIAANIDIEKCVFVSITTSIIINFKLMLDKEPTIICMNRMNKYTEKTEAEKVFDRVKAIYSNDSFFIPVNDDEFRICVETVEKNFRMR